jgi:uncharacterized membrane protein
MKASNPPIFTHNKMQIEVSTIIRCTPDMVYKFWRELPNLHLVMYHLKSVRTLSVTNSEWIVKIPGGIGDLKWEAKIVKDDPGKYLEWATLPGATIEHEGYVKFNTNENDQTQLDISVSYNTLMHIGGKQISSMLNKVVEEIISNELQGLKAYLESSVTGET